MTRSPRPRDRPARGGSARPSSSAPVPPARSRLPFYLLGGGLAVAVAVAAGLGRFGSQGPERAGPVREVRSAEPERQARPVTRAAPSRAAPRATPVPSEPVLRAPAADPPDEPELAEVEMPTPALSAPPSAAPDEAEPAVTEETAPAAETPAVVAEEPAPAPTAPAPSKPRTVRLTFLQSWTDPGMCTKSGHNQAARQSLIGGFRYWDGGERGQFRLDPRLSLQSVDPIIDYIADAEREVARRLKLQTQRPETFLYYDQALLRAAACVNMEVVAYYDGALHVVPGDDDVRASVLHEYTHHALFSAGLKGPAWAQEGIAMNVAGETWWRDRQRLSALLHQRFSIDDLDERIPYKLQTEQAVDFYAQSAALVACLLENKHWELDQLLSALRARAEIASYDLPEVEQAWFLNDCLERWSKQ